MTMLDLVEETTTTTTPIEPGDHERLSHFVPQKGIVESAVTGAPVRALCGKVWTPSRDPEKFPVCPECQEAYDQLEKE